MSVAEQPLVEKVEKIFLLKRFKAPFSPDVTTFHITFVIWMKIHLSIKISVEFLGREFSSHSLTVHEIWCALTWTFQDSRRFFNFSHFHSSAPSSAMSSCSFFLALLKKENNFLPSSLLLVCTRWNCYYTFLAPNMKKNFPFRFELWGKKWA